LLVVAELDVIEQVEVVQEVIEHLVLAQAHFKDQL
tara:strand:+ start:294 stop:398 length:105 start_codon:yes stop_codon:yes gene_type:complete